MSDVDVRLLLSHLGIRARAAGRRKYEARCPHPDHDDSNPSWSIVAAPGEKRNGSHHCQSCKRGGGPWELAAWVWGCDVAEAGRRLHELFGGRHEAARRVPSVKVREDVPRHAFDLPLGVVIPGPGGRWYGPAIDYLERERGVTREEADRWGLGYAIRGRLRNRVVIPVRDAHGRLLSYSSRLIPGTEPGRRYDTGREAHGARARRAMWGEEFWALERRVVVACEGVFSGIRLLQAGAPSVAALLGSAVTEEKVGALVRAFDAVLIATDPDPAGRRAGEWLAVLGRHCRVAGVDLDVSPDDTEVDDLRERIDAALSVLC